MQILNAYLLASGSAAGFDGITVFQNGVFNADFMAEDFDFTNRMTEAAETVSEALEEWHDTAKVLWTGEEYAENFYLATGNMKYIRKAGTHGARTSTGGKVGSTQTVYYLPIKNKGSFSKLWYFARTVRDNGLDDGVNNNYFYVTVGRSYYDDAQEKYMMEIAPSTVHKSVAEWTRFEVDISSVENPNYIIIGAADGSPGIYDIILGV